MSEEPLIQATTQAIMEDLMIPANDAEYAWMQEAIEQRLQVFAEQLVDAAFGEVGGPPECPDEPEVIRADTTRPLTFEQLASALDRISTPSTAPDEPLSFDPDDYPVV